MRMLENEGIDHDYVETQSSEHAISTIIDAGNDGFTDILAIGGDGTIHHAANAAINAGLTLGIVPAGSGNDFANSLHIDENPEKAIQTFIANNRISINVTKVTTSQDEYYSINVTDAGMGGKVAKESLSRLKWLHGRLKYNILAMGVLLKFKEVPTVIKIDGREMELNIRLIAAGLGQTFGSGMNILPDARFDMDRMQIGILHDATRLQTLNALLKAPKAKHVGLKYIIMEWAKTLEVSPVNENDELIVESEGELHGTVPLKMEIVPQALQVIVPENYSTDLQTKYRSR